MELTTSSLKETHDVAYTFIKDLDPQVNATVVGLYGDLGAGKTAFTKGVAKALGIHDEITSPTFVIEKVYKLTNQKFESLIHIDAYRLEKDEELLHLGWNELLKNQKNLIIIEWPENVINVMPPHHKKIFFTFVDENTRIIKVQ